MLVVEYRLVPVIAGRRIALPLDWCKRYNVRDGSALVMRVLPDNSIEVAPVAGAITYSGRTIKY